MKETIIDPNEYISNILEKNGYGENLRIGHIEYDKSTNENYDYQIIRSSTHDGTFLFKYMLIDESLKPLINKTTICKGTITDEELKDLIDIKYIIGDIRLEIDYELGKEYDTVYIPVRCEYIF